MPLHAMLDVCRRKGLALRKLPLARRASLQHYMLSLLSITRVVSSLGHDRLGSLFTVLHCLQKTGKARTCWEGACTMATHRSLHANSDYGALQSCAPQPIDCESASLVVRQLYGRSCSLN